MDPKDYFNSKAAEWAVLPEHQRRSQMVAEYIRDKVRLRPGATAALDFGCGSGQLALYLHRYVRTITAVDAAENMIALLNEKLRTGGIVNIQTQVLDIERELRLLPRQGFDLVYSQMVLHHLEDTAKVLRELRTRLRPEGVLCLIDLDHEDGSFHTGDVFIPHHGFVRDELRRQLEESGFFDVEFYTPYTIKKLDAGGQNREYPLFLALARPLPAAEHNS